MSDVLGNGRHVFEGESKRLEQILEQFESAWLSGQKPVIDSYLSSADVEPRSLLVELVHADLECRLKAGERVRVETYLEKYAELAKDRPTALRLISAEYEVRRRHEPGLLLDEYLQRFPQFRADLPETLPGPHARAPEKPGHDGANRVGKFELLEQVGEGAFGTVYRARDTELNRIVAVKLPRADRSHSTADAEKFLREARNAAQLTHPSIVPVYEVGHDAAVPYIVSAYIEGVTLADALLREHLDYTQTARVMAQVADALDHAHRQGVVHRDLKPSNIMLGRIEGVGARESGVGSPESETPTRDPRFPTPNSRLPSSTAFVMDFGLARRDDGEIRTTVDGMVLGTPAYMSPEQARGENNRVKGRSDQYALGVILYELLTGEVPFRGAARMVLQQILNEEPKSPRKMDDKIPRDLETIALKCMAKEQSRRYPTSGELAADLRRFTEGVPILARPVGRLERGWRWAKRNPRVAGLSAAVVLLLFLGAVGATVASFIINAKKTEAEHNKIAADNSKTAAEHSAELARQHLELTLESMHKLVHEVQNQLKDQPALHPLRERLLRDALTGLQRVAAATSEIDVDGGLVSAHEKLGDIFLEAGHPVEARQQYEKAAAFADRQSSAAPSARWGRFSLPVANSKLGRACLRLGDIPAATTYCQKAVTLAEQAARENPGSLNDVLTVADCEYWLGQVEMQRGDIKSAVENFERSAGRILGLKVAWQQTTDVKMQLAEIYEMLGEAKFRLGLYGEAGAAFEKSKKVHQEAADAQPQNMDVRYRLAIDFAKLGNVALLNKDFAAAETALRASLAYYEEVASTAPKNSLAQANLAMAYGRLGEFYFEKRDWSSAHEQFRKVLAPMEAFASAYPDDRILKRNRAISYFKLAVANREMGASEDARKFREKALNDLEALVKQSPGDASLRIDQANILRTLGNADWEVYDYPSAMQTYLLGIPILRQLDAEGKVKGNPALEKLQKELSTNLGLCRKMIAMSLWPRPVFVALEWITRRTPPD